MKGYGDLDRFIKKDRVIIVCTPDSCDDEKQEDKYIVTRKISALDDNSYINHDDFSKIRIKNYDNSIILMSEKAVMEPGEVYILYRYCENIDGLPVFLIFSKTDFFKQLEDFAFIIPEGVNSYFKIRKGITRLQYNIEFWFLDDDFKEETYDDEMLDIDQINENIQ